MARLLKIPNRMRSVALFHRCRWRKYRAMFSASFTSATNLIFPPQRPQVSTSIFRHRRISSCQGRYRQRCVGGRPGVSFTGGSEWQPDSAMSVGAVIAAGGGDGTISGLHLLCGASTPPYRTLWNLGGCTEAASREMRDSGSISTETVPSRKGFFSFRTARRRGRTRGGFSRRCKRERLGAGDTISSSGLPARRNGRLQATGG
jgi:hypothetical protein